MSFSLSPSVNVREFDLSTIIPQVSTTVAAISGVFHWGPLETRVLIDSEKALDARFGKPSNFNGETWFSAASFLAYGNSLLVSRAANTSGISPIKTATTTNNNATILVSNTADLSIGMLVVVGDANVASGARISSITNSTAVVLNSNSFVTGSGNSSIQFVTNGAVFSAVANVGTVANLAYNVIKNNDDFTAREGTFDPDVLFVARYPGAMGNSLRVSVCDTANAFNGNVVLSTVANGAVVDLLVGSNVATVTVTLSHDGSSANTARLNVNTATQALIGEINVTDYLQFGNSDIGHQSLKITNITALTSNVNTTIAAATFTIEFEDELRLIADQSISTQIQRFWEFYDLVESAPAVSEYVRNYGNSAAVDELHVVVVDDGGLFSGLPGTVLESYKAVSRATDAKTIDGATNYFRNLINQKSQYIWSVNDLEAAYSNTSLNVASLTNDVTVTSLDFKYGQDGADEGSVTIGTLVKGYDLFAASEEVDVSIILQGKARGGTAGGQLANYITDNITEKRKDCVVTISPEKSDVVNALGFETPNMVEFRNSLRDSSYSFLDSGYKYMYDRYNDIYRWVPLNGDTAGLMVRTDETNDAWWSPAGYNRGHIKNVVKLAYNPRKADRDELYKNGINPVVTFPGQGTVLFGDKTLLARPSAFDRINVRRLFIVIEKAIATAAKYFLFEFNDDFTRAQFRNMVVPYLREIQGRRGIQDFLFVCDKTNNTATVIDANQLVGDIYVKPARSINFINLNFVAVRTGTTFSEIVGKFGG